MKPVTHKITHKYLYKYRIYGTNPGLDPAFRLGRACVLLVDDELFAYVLDQLEGNYQNSLFVDESLRSLKLPLWMYLRSPRLTLDRLQEMWWEMQVVHRVAYAKRRYLRSLRKVRDKYANKAR